MNVAELLLGRRDFCPEDEIIQQVRNAKFYDDDLELNRCQIDCTKKFIWH